MKHFRMIFVIVTVFLSVLICDDYRLRRAAQRAEVQAVRCSLDLKDAEQDAVIQKLYAEKCQKWAAHVMATGRIY